MNFTKIIVNALKHWTTDKLNKKVDKEDFIALKNAKPDWNQNDSSADDYVKNRPFYSGELVETELFSTTITSYVQYQDGMGIAQLSLDKEVVLTEGETYKVIWNGVEYETVAWNLDGTPGIGDKSMIDSSTSTGEPFLISLPGDMGVVYAFDLTSETDARTISILGFVQEIIKIPEKYLPDYISTPTTASIGQTIVVKSVDENGKPTEWETIDPWVITSPNGTQFKLTIDDEGILSAAELV